MGIKSQLEVEFRNAVIQTSLAQGKRPPPDPELYDPTGKPSKIDRLIEWAFVIVFLIFIIYFLC